MDDSSQAQFLALIGRMTALRTAVASLIALAPDPAACRDSIAGQIRATAGYLQSTGNLNHAVLAGAMQEELEELLATD